LRDTNASIRLICDYIVPQKENTALVRKVRLIMIDEVHLLNERGRGAVLEAIVSRMKTVQKSGVPLHTHSHY
jgi:replicative superfamily II helicase